MSREGVKYDGDKPRWGLLPLRETQDVVDVLTAGSKKYSDDNWKYVDNAQERYFDALLRHIIQYRFAKERGIPDLINDVETGKSHLAHAICCALFIMWFDNDKKIEASPTLDELLNSGDWEPIDISDIDPEDEDDYVCRNIPVIETQTEPNERTYNRHEVQKLRQRSNDLEQTILLNEFENEADIMQYTTEIGLMGDRIKELEQIILLNELDNEKVVHNLNKDIEQANNQTSAQEILVMAGEVEIDTLGEEIIRLNKLSDAQAKHLQYMADVNENLRQKNLKAGVDLDVFEERFRLFDKHACGLVDKLDSMDGELIELNKQKADAQKNMSTLDDLLVVQTTDGNWNYDPYMYGMANGMILARHIILDVDGECPYKVAPPQWIADEAAGDFPVIEATVSSD